MSEPLTFSVECPYEKQDGIWVPVVLVKGSKSFSFDAKLDTGAHNCLFQRDYGRALGLEIENGERKSFGLPNKQLIYAFGHQITLITAGLSFQTTVYFFEDPLIEKNVLGRYGWLDQLRIGIVDVKLKLFLNEND